MDPLQFGVNSDVVLEVVGLIVVLSLFVERALCPLFEWRIFIDRWKAHGLKEPIAFGAALGVIAYYRFDALAVVFSREQSSMVGYLVTAGIVAGGSKGSVKLFRDLLGWKSEAQKTYETGVELKRALNTSVPPSGVGG